MSCLISFVWSSPSCYQRDISEKFKMLMYASTGNRTSEPIRVFLLPLGYRGCWRQVNKKFTLLIYATILQELCVVYKGIYRKRKINHCLLTVSWLIPFRYEMINTREEIDYIWYLFYFSIWKHLCLVTCRSKQDKPTQMSWRLGAEMHALFYRRSIITVYKVSNIELYSIHINVFKMLSNNE